ncbi:uncharacterized protein [Fopius arisanus]|uniref:Uncharacterized protein isoform X2 n=1 Tax=Fopius arisanus TaxID=64838 RepID=A0A9R1SWA9_9HYME|nr:PREDICTED: uncharacterized protein LOC105263668 isoform X2 [Fopius arisanus]
MPGKIKVRILAGRNLPVMDRSGDTTDAYVEIKFGNTTYKTDVCRKTLNPQWNSEWYRFEVDDAELQDEPLQLRLMDHDTYSANDAIGKVYLNLNPLLLPGLPPPVKNIWTLEAALNSSAGSQGGSVMTGWIPVFDTMHGIRGEVSIIVKVELFSDFNKFRQSSCGVQFFYSPNVPQGYHVQVIHGFVEELIVSDDPEYKWIDKIRTPRASNEARQTLFFKLSGEVQRKIGLKALDLGGNAVIGYCQNFDLEGESGIVARGIGTAVTLMKLQDISLLSDSQNVEDLSYFVSQYKTQLDYSESDDGLPLLPNTPSPLSRSPTSLETTKIGKSFPKHDWNKRPRIAMRITDYKSTEVKRQMSLQCSPLENLRKSGALSTHSLSDELIRESSLRTMLALEDMRGERTSAFSRGLKNLRYLPKKMIQMKSKISDSFDEESDDSTYSSTWSVAGSDTTRSSFSELRQSIRRKKFTHKKNQSEGIAAMLIKSVHAGFPLDCVLEDRETPAPSPVNFLENFESTDGETRPFSTSDDGNSNQEAGEDVSIEHNVKCNVFGDKNHGYDYTEGHVPMMSSSETDTSTSDDEPSESSTNYNILEDSLIIEKFDEPPPQVPGNSVVQISRTFEEKESLEERVQNSSTDYNILDDSFSHGIECSNDALNGTHLQEIEGINPSDSDKPETSNNLQEVSSNQNVQNAIHNTLINPFSIEIESNINELTETHRSDSEGNIITKIIEKNPSLEKNGLNSSTDYNILDDIASGGQELSNEELNVVPSRIAEGIDGSPSEQYEISGIFNKEDQDLVEFSQGIILGCSCEPDDSALPLIPSLSDSEIKLPLPYELSLKDSALKTSPSFKLKVLGKQRKFDTVDESFLAASTPVDVADRVLPPNFEERSADDSEAVPALDTHDISLSNEIPESSLIDLSDIEVNAPPKFHPEVIAVIRKEKPPLDSKSPRILETMHHNNAEISSKTSENSIAEDSPIPYKRYLFQSGSLEGKSRHDKKDRTPKKVSRTETVIYKGPPKLKPQAHLPESQPGTSRKNPETRDSKSLSIPSKPAIIIDPASTDNSHLKPPAQLDLDVNIHTPYCIHNEKPLEFPLPQEFTIEAQHMSERFRKNYRQYCMLDLIRTIDIKMMAHHMHVERKESTRSKKRHGHRHVNSTPSPESIHRIKSHRRNSRSKSPERHHHHHHSHHTHQISPLVTHSPNPTASSSYYSTKSSKSPQSPVESSPRHANLNEFISKDKLIPSDKILDHDKIKRRNELSRSINNDFSDAIPLSVIKKSTNSQCLDPKEIDISVHKSHSEDSLEDLQSHLSITNITNLAKMTDETRVASPPLNPRLQEESSSPVHPPVFPASVGSKGTNTPATKLPAPLHRRSSDSDLSITPKGNSLAGSDRSMGGHLRPSTAIVRTMNQDALEMLEYPFITMQYYPAGFVLHLGGLVSARSVKLIERITNLEEPEGRDAWWKEIRMEVRSHARALGCNVVLGYKEEISICDDVCVLNASGTAAVINLLNTSQDQEILLNKTQTPAVTNPVDAEKERNLQKIVAVKSEKSEEVPGAYQNQPLKIKRISESNEHETPHVPFQSACSLCHLPYNESSVPFRVDVSKCAICRRYKVPDVLFTTIELPDNIPTTGGGCFLQATVCKNKRDLRGELNAKEISDCLPFLEYELHSLLLNKLKVKGMNAIFGLKVQVSIGERLVIGMAVGTAVFLTALPVPSVPKIASGNTWHNEEQLGDIQKNLIETVKKNREYYRLKPLADIENGRAMTTSDTDESDDDLPDLDLGAGTKDACILEVDDVEDMDRINLLMDDRPPDDFHVVNTQSILGLEDLEIVRNLQMFTQISRAKIPSGQFASMPSKYFARILQTIFFKLRRMVPCALCDMQFKVALPEQDEIQLTVVGMALGLGEPTKMSRYKKKGVNNSSSKDQLKKSDDNDLIFSLDEDHAENLNVDGSTGINQSLTSVSNSPLINSNQKCQPKSPFKSKSHQHKYKHVPLKERYGVDITPLSYLPGGRIERYLGNLNFFFIRESTSIRENGGLSGFTHSFVTEVLAIVRAHITALGGNAMVAFFMMQCVLQHSPHKNQGQCLINVGGDVVSVSYFGDERHNQNC